MSVALLQFVVYELYNVERVSSSAQTSCTGLRLTVVLHSDNADTAPLVALHLQKWNTETLGHSTDLKKLTFAEEIKQQEEKL